MHYAKCKTRWRLYLNICEKNHDIRDHLDELKKNNVVITYYLCEAFRFYEKHKKGDKLNKNDFNKLDIGKLIEEKIKAITCVSNLINIDKKSKSLEDD